MGQAKQRGTYDQRVEHALAGPQKAKRLSARERDALIAQVMMESVGKMFCELGIGKAELGIDRRLQ